MPSGAIDAVIAPAKAGEHIVADGAGGLGDIVHGEVVADQRGNPTSALDIADALIAIAARLKDDVSPALRGVFHMTGSGEATWADLAETVFRQAAARGRRLTHVRRIATADYPTPARRPANSRLDNEKLARVYGVRLPEWRQSVAGCCDRLLS